MKHLFLLLIILVIFLSPSYSNDHPVYSRSCPRTSPGQPCYEYGRADIIFIGTVIEVKKISWDGPPPIDSMPYKKVIARLSVDEVFKGIDEKEIVFEMDKCPIYFKVGGRYLVYSNRKPDGKLEQNDQYPTRLLTDTEADILYINSLKGTPPLGNVRLGIYRNTNSWKPWLIKRDPKNYPQEAIPGIKIIIESPNHKFEAVTSDKEWLEINNVPAGSYQVSTTIPNNLGVLGLRGNLIVTGHGCFIAGFQVVPRGQLSGRVLDSEGVPIAGVRVYFFSPQDVRDEIIEDINKKKMEIWEIHSLDTDIEGRYKVQALPKGKYIIAVNVIRDSRKTEEDSKKYPRTFYPGVSLFSQATIINLDEGEAKQNLDIKLPPIKGL